MQKLMLQTALHQTMNIKVFKLGNSDNRLISCVTRGREELGKACGAVTQQLLCFRVLEFCFTIKVNRVPTGLVAPWGNSNLITGGSDRPTFPEKLNRGQPCRLM